MPRQTRAERRARRQQQVEDQTGGAQRAHARQQHVRPAEPVQAEAPVKRAESGGGFRRFLGESWGELQKVEWPTQRHVVQGTVVVLVACIIVGTYLWVADIVSKHLVENILLK